MSIGFAEWHQLIYYMASADCLDTADISMMKKMGFESDFSSGRTETEEPAFQRF